MILVGHSAFLAIEIIKLRTSNRGAVGSVLRGTSKENFKAAQGA